MIQLKEDILRLLELRNQLTDGDGEGGKDTMGDHLTVGLTRNIPKKIDYLYSPY